MALSKIRNTSFAPARLYSTFINIVKAQIKYAGAVYLKYVLKFVAAGKKTWRLYSVA